MAGIYNILKTKAGQSLLNWTSDTIKAALLRGYSFDASHSVWADVSAYEVTGIGYDDGGVTLGSKSITQDDNADLTKYIAENATWSNSSITADSMVIYNSANGYLMAHFDFGQDYISDNGTFSPQITDGVYFTIS